MSFSEVKDRSYQITNLTTLGSLVIGYFIRKRAGKYGPLYDIITPENVSLSLKGNTDLINKMDLVKPGCLVRVTLKEMKTTNAGNELKIFKVEYDQNDMFDLGKVKEITEDESVPF